MMRSFPFPTRDPFSFGPCAWLCALVLAVACGHAGPDANLDGGASDAIADGGAPDATTDGGAPGDALFARDRLLQVSIELPEDDWQRLSRQGRETAATFAGCVDREFGYDNFLAEVTIDGETVTDVSVRKKGFLGSISLVRPSLKLDFGRDAHDGRTFHGRRRITLNNNKQDPSNIHQCLFYDLATAAGLVAPRCSLAHVEVNGTDLGYYTHVEAIKKPFLARHYGSDDGNLYEAQLADFSEARVDNFELKTNEAEGDRSDLDRVVQALDVGDDALLDAVSQVFDLDEFMRFWALESLTGHWDGMTGNRNNHYVYHDPTDDLFHPIPWGTDLAFTGQSPFGSGVQAASVYVNHRLSERLYGIPEARARYHAALRDLLDSVWDEDALLASAHRIAEMTDAPAAPVETLEAFIRGRRSAIMAELAQHDGDGPDVTSRESGPLGCNPPPATEGRFELAWSDAGRAMTAYKPLADGTLSYTIPLASGPLMLDDMPLLGAAYRDESPADGDPDALRLGFLGLVEGRQVVVQFTIPKALYGAREIPFHGTEVWGLVVEVRDEAPGFRLHGVISDGTLVLEEAGMTDGAPVRGHWTGKLAPLSAGLR